MTSRQPVLHWLRSSTWRGAPSPRQVQEVGWAVGMTGVSRESSGVPVGKGPSGWRQWGGSPDQLGPGPNEGIDYKPVSFPKYFFYLVLGPLLGKLSAPFIVLQGLSWRCWGLTLGFPYAEHMSQPFRPTSPWHLNCSHRSGSEDMMVGPLRHGRSQGLEQGQHLVTIWAGAPTGGLDSGPLKGPGSHQKGLGVRALDGGCKRFRAAVSALPGLLPTGSTTPRKPPLAQVVLPLCALCPQTTRVWNQKGRRSSPP